MAVSGKSDDVISDEALVERVRASPTDDLREFDILVNRHRARVIANCRHLTRQPNHAEDLAQEVFLKAYFGLQRFRGGSLFRTWLQRIKINHCFDYLKRHKGSHFVDVEDLEVAGAPEVSVGATAERDVIRAETRDYLTSAMDALPDGLRIPLVLRDLDGLAYSEIAKTLGIGLSAVKMRIFRGRQQLRARLEAEMPRHAPGGESTGGERSDD